MKIYTLDVALYEDDEEFKKAYQQLPESRQKKIDGFHYEKDKRLSLGAGILLQRGLEKQGILLRQVTIGYESCGKPYIVEHPGIHFNLSHSGELVAAAFMDRKVGIDVQEVVDYNPKIAERFYTREENSYISSFLSFSERSSAFCRIWTLKEAFMKVTGLGMSLDTTSFSVIPGNPVILTHKVNDHRYEFLQKELSGYCLAVAWEMD